MFLDNWICRFQSWKGPDWKPITFRLTFIQYHGLLTNLSWIFCYSQKQKSQETRASLARVFLFVWGNYKVTMKKILLSFFILLGLPPVAEVAFWVPDPVEASTIENYFYTVQPGPSMIALGASLGCVIYSWIMGYSTIRVGCFPSLFDFSYIVRKSPLLVRAFLFPIFRIWLYLLF